MKFKFLTFIPTVALGFLGFLGLATGYALANDTHNHSGHQMDEPQLTALPTEPGQSGFAAIAEIVNILENDPDTDWSKVNINTLREHLVDMNALTIGSSYIVESDDTSISFITSGTGPSLRALQNMVPAHAAELDKMNDWEAEGTATDTGAILTITPKDKSDLQRVEALGFFGLMATGAHHQPHHLGMASGQMVH